LDLGPDALLGLAPTRARRGRLCGSDEVEEMGALGVVELERPSQRIEHAVGDPVRVAALQTRVVGNAHARQDGDLLPAQPRDPTTPVRLQTRLLRCDPGAPGGEELADLLLGLHAASVDP
jgi:hypothetical protein